MTPWRGAGVAVTVLVAAVTVRGRLSRSGATRRAARFSSHSEASSPDDIEAFWTDERIDEATATMPTVDARYGRRRLAVLRLLPTSAAVPMFRTSAAAAHRLHMAKRRFAWHAFHGKRRYTM